MSRLVFEITEHTRIDDYSVLARQVQAIRDRGALLAIDDAGAGYASLKHVLALRPDFIKLDRGLVENIDHDVAKQAVVEMLGEFAARLNAWIIAEGVEREEELAELQMLSVPLAQGYFLARPSVVWEPLSTDSVRSIAAHADATRDTTSIRSLCSRRKVVPHGASLDDVVAAFAVLPGRSDLAVADADGRVRSLVRLRDAQQGQLCVSAALVVEASASLASAATRAVTRPLEARFDSLIVHGEAGEYLGVVGIDRLLKQLVAHATKREASAPEMTGTQI